MAQWVVVYSKKPIQPNSDDLLKALEKADLHLLAETLDIDEDAVDAVLSQLRVEERQDRMGTILDLHYQPQGRPISIWTYHPQCAQEQINECLEEIPPTTKNRGAIRVRNHLSLTRGVMGIELGLTQLETIAEILAMVLGYSLAERSEGLVDFYGNEWYSPDDRVTPVWAAEEPR